MTFTLKQLLATHHTDKDKGHTYGDVYEVLFAPIRDTATLVVELGIDQGGSLQCWEKFFTQAHIVGVDFLDCQKHRTERTSIVQADVSSQRSLMNGLLCHLTYGSCDVIIDDGPHDVVQQIGCLHFLWPFVKPGGLYIVEDALQLFEYLEMFDHVPVLPGMECELHDRRKVAGRTDDILFVWRKEAK